ncbi:MAG: helix-turn-helix domain-containing protein [Candidatus Moranbacteria bacterium]|nr:helix-turn-helix domain-containing protein [Candidatus Moranbacteria bacterium]
MLSNDLEKLGLSDKEAKVYLAVLELGEGNIAQIAKKSGVKRTTVYDIALSLKSKNLLLETMKGKKNIYSAEDPRKLDDVYDERKATLKKILPELLSVMNAIEKKPRIRYFEGAEGIKEVYKDTLKYPDQEIQAWVTSEAMTKFDVEWLEKYYVPKRLEKKIWARVIAPKTEEVVDYQERDEKSLRQTRLVDPKEFPMEVEINLYGGRNIGVMAFGEQMGLVIESRKIYKTLKSIFELGWKSLEKYAKMNQ